MMAAPLNSISLLSPALPFALLLLIDGISIAIVDQVRADLSEHDSDSQIASS